MELWLDSLSIYFQSIPAMDPHSLPLGRVPLQNQGLLHPCLLSGDGVDLSALD